MTKRELKDAQKTALRHGTMTTIELHHTARLWARAVMSLSDKLRKFEEAGSKCLRCGDEIVWQVGVSLCAECRDDEAYEEAHRFQDTQTLADVGMCEADFR